MNKHIILLYIYIYSYLKINKNYYIYYYYNNNIYNNSFIKFYYIYYYLCFYIYNNIDIKFSHFCFKIIKNNFLLIKNNSILINLELYKKNININIFKKNYFFNLKNIKIIFFNDFKFKIELFFLLTFRDHIEFIRISKYHEYLNVNPLLYNYPLLKIFLRYYVKFRIDKVFDNESYFLSQNDFFYKYSIYHYQIIEQKNKILNINYNIFNKLKLNINNIEFIKYIFLFNKVYNLYFLFEFYLFRFSIIYFLLLLWLRKIAHFEIVTEEDGFEDDDWTDIEKTTDDDIYLVYWNIHRYGFDLEYYYSINIWLYLMWLLIYKNIKIINILEIVNINYFNIKIINILSLFWYKVIEFICVDFMSALLFYFSLANSYLYKFVTNYEIKIYCSSMFNRYCFGYFPINYNIYYNLNNLIKHIYINKKNYDYFYWKIFYTCNIDYRYNYNFNIINIINKNYVDNYIYNQYILLFNIYIKYNNKYYQEYNIMNYYHYIILILDIIKKILYKLKFLKYKTYYNKILKFIQYKHFLYYYKTYNGLHFWFKFYKLNKFEWKYKFHWILKYSIYLLYIWYYYYIFIIIIYNYWYLYLSIIKKNKLKKIINNNKYKKIIILLYY